MTHTFSQRGNTLVGFILGLVVGLTVALGVAVYVTKVPIPFLNKGLTHSADQDANEDKKNKDWDPNAPLYNKSTSKTPASATATPAEASGSDKAGASSNAPSSPLASVASPTAKAEAPSNPLTSVFGPATGGDGAAASSDKADPMADLARSKANGIDAFMFYVQAGAFRTHDEADTQKGKLALAGFDTTLSERDQGGKTVYRVRVGPLNTKDEADKIQQKLVALKVDSVVVRVQK